MFPRPLHPGVAQICKILQGAVHLPISSRQTCAGYRKEDTFAVEEWPGCLGNTFTLRYHRTAGTQSRLLEVSQKMSYACPAAEEGLSLAPSSAPAKTEHRLLRKSNSFNTVFPAPFNQ